MSVDAKLSRLDRAGSILGGVGAVAYALVGSYDNAWVRGVIIIVGLAFVAGGIWGT